MWWRCFFTVRFQDRHKDYVGVKCHSAPRKIPQIAIVAAIVEWVTWVSPWPVRPKRNSSSSRSGGGGGGTSSSSRPRRTAIIQLIWGYVVNSNTNKESSAGGGEKERGGSVCCVWCSDCSLQLLSSISLRTSGRRYTFETFAQNPPKSYLQNGHDGLAGQDRIWRQHRPYAYPETWRCNFISFAKA